MLCFQFFLGLGMSGIEAYAFKKRYVFIQRLQTFLKKYCHFFTFLKLSILF